jgi:hypothetical protein
MKTMKKYTFIFIILAALAPSVSFAQVTPAAKPETPNQTALAVDAKAEALSVRRQKVDAQLRGILTQFTTIYTRISIAIDRLAENDINIDKARLELNKANLALAEAKLNIDAFGKIPVTDEADKAKGTSALLKESVKKSEDSLKVVRDTLIQTLVDLKLTLTATTDAE